MSCPKFDEFREQFIPFVDDFFINFSLIVHEKSLNIPDDLENDFEDNLNFYVLCLLLGGNAIFETLRIRSGERRRIINNIFQNQSRESSLPYPYVVGLAEFLTNVMPIVIGDFYKLIDQYTIRPTIAESVDVVTMRQRRNLDTDSNNSTSGDIIDEMGRVRDPLAQLTQVVFININHIPCILFFIFLFYFYSILFYYYTCSNFF